MFDITVILSFRVPVQYYQACRVCNGSRLWEIQSGTDGQCLNIVTQKGTALVFASESNAVDQHHEQSLVLDPLHCFLLCIRAHPVQSGVIILCCMQLQIWMLGKFCNLSVTSVDYGPLVVLPASTSSENSAPKLTHSSKLTKNWSAYKLPISDFQNGQNTSLQVCDGLHSPVFPAFLKPLH